MDKKKVLTIVGIIIIVIIIVLSFIVGPNNKNDGISDLSNDPQVIITNAQQESAAVKEEEKKEFAQIDVATYLDYYRGSELKIILLARPTCQYCQIAEPILQKIAKEYNLDIHYLNTDNFTDDSQADFVQSNEVFADGYGTPYLFLVKDGTIVDSVDGLTDRAHYISFFTVNGFIS